MGNNFGVIMQNIRNFQLSEPTESQIQLYTGNGEGVLFLTSEDGLDWYESQKKFAADSMKFVYDSNKTIVAASYDVSTLWPVDASVAEVKAEKVPAGFDPGGKWQFTGGRITEIPVDYAIQAEATKTRLMAQATAAIAPLQDAVELEIATEKEIDALSAWKKCRVLLSRIDTSAAPDINWPEVPEDVA